MIFFHLQEEKIAATLQERGTGSLDERVVTICSGLDLVNINYTHMVAPDPATASVRAFSDFSVRLDQFKALKV